MVILLPGALQPKAVVPIILTIFPFVRVLVTYVLDAPDCWAMPFTLNSKLVAVTELAVKVTLVPVQIRLSASELTIVTTGGSDTMT